VDLTYTLIYALYTKTDSAANFQELHTYYPYMIT
jgi:hypothetical protein